MTAHLNFGGRNYSSDIRIVRVNIQTIVSLPCRGQMRLIKFSCLKSTIKQGICYFNNATTRIKMCGISTQRHLTSLKENTEKKFCEDTGRVPFLAMATLWRCIFDMPKRQQGEKEERNGSGYIFRIASIYSHTSSSI